MKQPDRRTVLPLLGLVALIAAPGCGAPLLQMQPNIPNGGRAVAVSVHPTDGNVMMVASESGGLFRSTDRGIRWSHVSGATTFGFTDVLHLPARPSTIVATASSDMRTVSGGGIWRSTDGGGSWGRPSITPPTTACNDEMAAFGLAFEAEPGRVWAGTLCGLAFSNDQGATWRYLPPASGYGNEKTYAVLVPAPGQIKILTDAGVKVSTDGGAHWSLSTAGLPPEIVAGVHNQIAASPLDHRHLYWAFNHLVWNAGEGRWNGWLALYRSLDNGASWTSLIDVPGINRPPFVKVAGTGPLSSYQIYFGDGGCGLRRATVTSGPSPAFSTWTPLAVDHCDASDLGFDTDRRSPLLLASDGGLHRTADGGLTWTFTGGGDGGYNALQVTEVTGQLHRDRKTADLYLATQDNDIWASPDEGATWGPNRCCEGFFLNIPRQALPAADTKLTGVSCAGCGNFVSGPLLAGQTGFPNPPNDAGNPRLLKPGFYVQNTRLAGVEANIFNLTENNGGSWTPRYGFAEDLRDLSKVTGTSSHPVVLTAVRKPGATADGNEIVGIRRITGVLGTGAPVVSEVAGFGSLGTFATMFAWYRPFGADPRDPNRFIVADVLDNLVKKSADGGATWRPDSALTRLVTETGSLRFRKEKFAQITSFGYDPDCAGHVMVGTQQAGIFQSFDYGANWSKVAGSEQIPSVSSFFFSGQNEAVASSYGRGLWKVRYDCPRRVRRKPRLVLYEPMIRWMGALIPIRDLGNPDACPVCGFFLTRGGRVMDFSLDPRTGRVTEVLLSGGEIRGVSWEGRELPVPFSVRRAEQRDAASAVRRAGRFGGDRELASLTNDPGAQVKGFFVQTDSLGTMRGVILAREDVTTLQLPSRRPEPPRIRVNLPSTGGVGVGTLGRIVIRGEGFAPGSPLEITLDRRQVRLEESPVVDARGRFTVSIPLAVGLGGHTILVRQRTSRGVVQDAYTFNVTVQDFGPGRQ